MSMYLHNKLNLPEDWSVTQGVRRRKPKNSQNEPENYFFFGSISGVF